MKKFLFCFLFLLFPLKTRAEIHQAVTYELSPGRFGDNLLSYIHAKWISYKYHLPLLYKPFIYSNCLVLHDYEFKYAENKNKFNTTTILGHNVFINSNDTFSNLYVVPYFPASKYELKNGISFAGTSWYYFEVDWHDKSFIEELRTVIAPSNPIALIDLPTDCVTVAVHVRRGGNHDTPETIPDFPLKFLSDEFYITQIKELYFLLNETPLYVYLFTDDNNPTQIMNKFQNNLSGLHIQFDCRKRQNSDTTNVIEDFFTLQQFDCLIHSESNFSFLMSKIGKFLVSIYPDSFDKKKGQIIYDNVNVTINEEHQKSNLITHFVKKSNQ